MSDRFALLSAASALSRRAPRPPRSLAGGRAPAGWQRSVARAAARLRTLSRLSAWPLAFEAAADPALHAGSPFAGYLSELVARSQHPDHDSGEATRAPRRDFDSRAGTDAHARSTRKTAGADASSRAGSRLAEDFTGADDPGTSARSGVRGAEARREARVRTPPFRRPRADAADTSRPAPSAAHPPDVAVRDTGRNGDGSHADLHRPDAGQGGPAPSARDSHSPPAWDSYAPPAGDTHSPSVLDSHTPAARAAHRAGHAPAEAHRATSAFTPDAAPLSPGGVHSPTHSAPDVERHASTPFDGDGAQASSRSGIEVMELPLEATPALLLRLSGATTPSHRGNGFEPAAQTHEARTSAPPASAPQASRADGPQVDARHSRQHARHQLPSFTPAAAAAAHSFVGAEPGHGLHGTSAGVPPGGSGKHDAPRGAAPVAPFGNAPPPALWAKSVRAAGARAVSLKSTRAFDEPQASRGAVRHAWLGRLVRRVERVLRRAGGPAGSDLGPTSSNLGPATYESDFIPSDFVLSDFVPPDVALSPLYRDWSWSLEGQTAPPGLLVALAGPARPGPDAGPSGLARDSSSSRTTPPDDRPRTPAAAGEAVTPAFAWSSGAASHGNFEPPPARNEHRQNVIPYAEDGARLLSDGEWADFSLPQRIAPPALAPSLPTLIPPRAVDVPILPVASETARLGARAEADAGEDDMELLAARIKFILDEQARRHGIDV